MEDPLPECESRSLENASLPGGQGVEDSQAWNAESSMNIAIAIGTSEERECSKKDPGVSQPSPVEDTRLRVCFQSSGQECTADPLVHGCVNTPMKVKPPHNSQQNIRNTHDRKNHIFGLEISLDGPNLECAEGFQEGHQVFQSLPVPSSECTAVEASKPVATPYGLPALYQVDSNSSSCMALAVSSGRLPSSPKWIVRNSFLEIETPSADKLDDLEPYAWTDERAGIIEYQSYPHLTVQSSTQSSLRDETERLLLSSDSSESTESVGSSSISSDESLDVDLMLAPSDTSALQGEHPRGRVAFSEYHKVPRHPVTGHFLSIGSLQHSSGACRPCEWNQRGRSCKYEWRCPYCHHSDHTTSNRRRRR